MSALSTSPVRIEDIEASGRVTMSVEEVAHLLGISRSSAYEAVKGGQLPSRRLGRRLFIPVPALRRWLEGDHDDAGSASRSEVL